MAETLYRYIYSFLKKKIVEISYFSVLSELKVPFKYPSVIRSNLRSAIAIALRRMQLRKRCRKIDLPKLDENIRRLVTCDTFGRR